MPPKPPTAADVATWSTSKIIALLQGGNAELRRLCAAEIDRRIPVPPPAGARR